jgi:hypothetical protein
VQRELRDNGMDHPVSRTVTPLSLHLELRDNPPNSNDPEDNEFVMENKRPLRGMAAKSRGGELRGDYAGAPKVKRAGAPKRCLP